MKWKEFVRDYLRFSRKDRTAAILLIVGMVIIYAVPFVFNGAKEQDGPVANDLLKNAIDTLEARRVQGARHRERDEVETEYSFSRTPDYTGKTLFLFDPNTLTTAEWESLGLPSKTAKTIRNYLGKGGRFYKPDDLKKIWGLPKGFYERVAGYIRIEGNQAERGSFSKPPERSAAAPARNISIADINTADSTAWIALPGIGQKLAARIAAFRDKLGGFHAVEQVAETYGLPDSTFQKIKPFLNVNAEGIRKLQVNTVSKEQLGTHPYIRWALANAIVEYRNRHGPYKSLDELKKIELMDEAKFIQISPYLEL